MQLFEEGGFDLILVRVLEYGVAHVYAVPVGEELAVPRLLHYLAVERDGLPCFYAPQGSRRVSCRARRAAVRPPRPAPRYRPRMVAAKNELVVGYLEEVAETRSLQDHEVRPVPPGVLYLYASLRNLRKKHSNIRPQAGQDDDARMRMKAGESGTGAGIWKCNRSVLTRRL